MFTYAANLADVIHEHLPESLTTQLEDAYDACIVESVASKNFTDEDWSISCSVMLGAKGHYTVYNSIKLEEAQNAVAGTEFTIDENYIVGDNYMHQAIRFYPDGSGVVHYILSGREYSFNWGSTFDDTYKTLKWDEATGWSRWIEMNEMEPVEFSPISFNFDFGDSSFTEPTK